MLRHQPSIRVELQEMSREFDAIVFGASGFTGQFVVEELAISMELDSLYKRNQLKVGVAGRNKEKIAKFLEESAMNADIDWIKGLPIIEADVEDYDSLLSMCKRTRLIITVVGPFRFYGEPLVRACIEARTDYVDISGEPLFLEGMQLKYYQEAKERGVYIVSAAGWDSVPADMGTTWTKQQFQGDLNGVEIFVASKAPLLRAQLNFGTWHSAIYGFALAHELVLLRARLFQEILPKPDNQSIYQQRRRPTLSYCDEIEGYCLPFPGPDKAVVERSELLKYHERKERPVYCETYFTNSSLFISFMLVLAAFVFRQLANYSWGRYLLKKFPRFFSMGAVSKEGVSRWSLKKCSFSHTIIGYGWDERLEDTDRQHVSSPTKKIITRVSGPDPAYFGTAMLLVHSGLTLLLDREKLPAPGVITPGACFRDTQLVDRLSKRAIKFEVLERF